MSETPHIGSSRLPAIPFPAPAVSGGAPLFVSRPDEAPAQSTLDHEAVTAALRILSDVAADLAGVAKAVGAIPFDEHLLATQGLSPLTGARAVESALAAAVSVLARAMRAEATGLLLGRLRDGAQEVDRSLAAEIDRLGSSMTGYVSGRAAPLLAVGAGIADGVDSLEGAVGSWLRSPHAAHLSALIDHATGGHEADDLRVRLAGHATGPGLGGQVANTLFDHPWLTDAAVRSGDGLWAGVGDLTGLPLGSLTAPDGAHDLLSRILGLGQATGHFHEHLVSVTPGAHYEVAAGDHLGPGHAPPTSVQSVFDNLHSLGHPGASDDWKRRQPGTIEISRVWDAGGRQSWVVEVPGTQVWNPDSGTNPQDLTSDLHLMSQADSALVRGVKMAMADAGIPDGAHVMLTGHSQGGIIAARLAADPTIETRYHVDAIVAGGAPIADIPVPASTHVLAVDHVQDPVPRLDGDPNPASPNWVTVTRDVRADVVPVDGVRNPLQAHLSEMYAATGARIDHSDDPGLTAFRRVTERFFDYAGAEVRTYELRRDG